MGITAALGISAGIAALSTGARIFEGHQAEKARERALKLRLKEERAATQQRQLKRTKELNHVLAQQTADESSRGLSLASPSFGAITRDTLENFKEDEDADKLNFQFKKTAIHNSIQDAKNDFLAGSVQAGLEGAQTIVDSYSSFATNKALIGLAKKRANQSKIGELPKIPNPF